MMKLKIRSIHEKGDASKEYVFLDVVEDCDLVRYGIADTTFTGENVVSNKLRHFYWFPARKAKKGDLVKLRTGKGKNSSSPSASGATTYSLFWGLDVAVWNDDGDAAVLFELATWAITKA